MGRKKCLVKDNGKATVVTQSNNNSEIKIHFIDVGQADCILIKQGDSVMLIDAGNNSDDKTIKAYLDKLGIKEINVLIATHPHEDHVGGMDFVIDNYKIDKIYSSEQTSKTKTFEDVLVSIKKNNLQITSPKIGEKFKIGEAECTILAPNKEEYDDLNNYSIVVKIEFKETTFLLVGDAEAISEMEMVKLNFNLKADVLKVGHHGSKSSSCINFLLAVKPKYAVISVGVDNAFNHPSQSTIDRLKSFNAQVFRTDENGTIIITSNGKDITCDKER